MLDSPRKLLNFSKISRLASKHDFQSVFASAHKISRPSLRLIYLANPLPHARIGIVISKQQVRRAVDRNRLRRIARESFRHHQAEVAGMDIVLILRSECSSLSKTALRERIDNLWSALVHANPSFRGLSAESRVVERHNDEATTLDSADKPRNDVPPQ